jgi:hypothetical protein
MGDVIAYNLNGTVQYAMFVLNGTNGVQLWDMSSHQIISLKAIQSEVIGFYQYDANENNFDLYLGIGDTKYAKETAGATLEFGDFPTNWGAGPDSHISFTRMDEFHCEFLCKFAGIGSGVGFTYEGAKVLVAYFTGLSVSPATWGWLAVSTAVLAADLISNYSPGDPIVTIESGPVPVLTQPKFPEP